MRGGQGGQKLETHLLNHPRCDHLDDGRPVPRRVNVDTFADGAELRDVVAASDSVSGVQPE